MFVVAERDNAIKNIKYISSPSMTCSFLIYKLLVKGHDNILKKVFQMILTITESESSVAFNNSVVSHIINRSSYFYFLFVL